MIAIIPHLTNTDEARIILMRDMKPLQVGRVYDPLSELHGALVLKTASTGPGPHEFIDLTEPSCCAWFIDADCRRRVILLPPGESVTLTVFNEE